MSLSFFRLGSLLLTLYSSLGITSQQILGLSPAAWWRYNTGITESSGAVSAWADQSGNSRNLVQATGTNQPALQGDGTILFDGVDNYLKCSAFTFNQPATICVLGKQITQANGQAICDGNTSDSMEFFQSTASATRVRLFAGANAIDNDDWAIDTYAAIRVVFSGASSLIQVNTNAAATGDPGAQNAGGFTLGGRGGAAEFSNIQVGEVILFPAALTAAQWNVIVYPWLKQQAALFGALI